MLATISVSPDSANKGEQRRMVVVEAVRRNGRHIGLEIKCVFLSKKE